MLLGVDVGGTFTDAVLVDGDSALHTAKVPSTPSQESVGVLEAVRLVLASAGAQPGDVARFAHGMTVATNALLEGRTARTALVATAGFTDVIELGRVGRAHLYELCLAAPAPLVEEELRFAAPERMGPAGPLLALDPALARKLVEELARAQPEAGGGSVMQSSGGLTDAHSAGAHPALTVLSGPAGGVGGALLLAELAHEEQLLCFDMGGTSCDVCVIDGSQVAETAERVIAGRPLSLPALDIHTVGAGGGSIAWRDPGGALRVGPASAGALPGPACYGRGGLAPTVTDANLLLGRLLADSPLAGGSG